MTTRAPRRGDRTTEQPDRTRPGRSVRSRAVLVLNVVLIAGVAIIGLTQVRTEDQPDRAVASDPAGVASTLPDPGAGSTGASAAEAPATAAAPSSAPATGTPAPGGVAPQAPRIRPTLRADFAEGDGWPVGAGFRETGRMAWPLGVVDGLMTHGPAQGPDAVSWLEKWTRTDVRTIGARVLFAPNHSGSAAITAWHTSVLDTTGLQQPRTGMRLTVQPGSWQLVALDGEGKTVLGSGTYDQVGRSASFGLVRREATAWVTDPSGAVTQVDDPRIASLSGPWASWELREGKVGSRPAGFQEVWAG